MAAVTLTEDQTNTLTSFITAVEGLFGVWPSIETVMRDEFDIDDPETALEEARTALMGG